MSDIDEKINNAVMDVLLDTNTENKKHIERLDNALKRSYIAIIFVVCLLFGACLYHEYSFKKFLMQFDFQTETVIDTDATNSTNTTNNGNINIKK